MFVFCWFVCESSTGLAKEMLWAVRAPLRIVQIANSQKQNLKGRYGIYLSTLSLTSSIPQDFLLSL